MRTFPMTDCNSSYGDGHIGVLLAGKKTGEMSAHEPILGEGMKSFTRKVVM